MIAHITRLAGIAAGAAAAFTVVLAGCSSNHGTHVPSLEAATAAGMDPARASAAAEAGNLYLAGPGRSCPMTIRTPDGQLWWAPPLVTISAAGTAMTPAASAPASACVTPSGPPAGGELDAAAATVAASMGVPYIAAAGSDPDGCHAEIHLAGRRPVAVDNVALGQPGGIELAAWVGGHNHRCEWPELDSAA